MIPWATREQCAKLDELMVEKFHVPVLAMMEQAGTRLAEFVRQEFPKSRTILICCGKGNNGGDGFAASRHLRNFGFEVAMYAAKESRAEPLVFREDAISLGVPIFSSLEKLKAEISKADLIIDCLIGYNLQGAPREPFAAAIRMLNKSGKPVIACDIPSGVDADKGAIFQPYVRASHILFLSLPKVGCKTLDAKKWVADIGVQKELYPLIGFPEEDYFSEAPLLQV